MNWPGSVWWDNAACNKGTQVSEHEGQQTWSTEWKNTVILEAKLNIKKTRRNPKSLLYLKFPGGPHTNKIEAWQYGTVWASGPVACFWELWEWMPGAGRCVAFSKRMKALMTGDCYKGRSLTTPENLTIISFIWTLIFLFTWLKAIFRFSATALTTAGWQGWS